MNTPYFTKPSQIMTGKELIDLLHHGEWTREQDNDQPIDDNGDDRRWGNAWITSTTVLPGGQEIEIIWAEIYIFDIYDPDDYETTADQDGCGWHVDLGGIVVVGEDGAELRKRDIIDMLGEDAPDDFSAIDYSAIIPEKEIIEIDLGVNVENGGMELINLEVTGGPDLRFVGEPIASVCSSPNNASGVYSGQNGRWAEYILYRTAAGRHVCQITQCTQWQGERDRYLAEVCDDESKVIEFFGHDWLAKELYKEAGIDAAIAVE